MSKSHLIECDELVLSNPYIDNNIKIKHKGNKSLVFDTDVMCKNIILGSWKFEQDVDGKLILYKKEGSSYIQKQIWN